MDNFKINALRAILKRAFNLDFTEFENTGNYKELFNILKNIQHEDKIEINLLCLLYKYTFIKTKENITENDYNKFISLCEDIAVPNEIKNNNEYNIINETFKKFNLEEKLIYLIYLLHLLKNAKVLFRAMEIILLIKDKYYVKNKKIKIVGIDNIEIMAKFWFLIEYSKSKEQLKYTIDFNENNIIKREPTIDELQDNVNFKRYTKENIKIFIKKKKKKKTTRNINPKYK